MKRITRVTMIEDTNPTDLANQVETWCNEHDGVWSEIHYAMATDDDWYAYSVMIVWVEEMPDVHD